MQRFETWNMPSVLCQIYTVCKTSSQRNAPDLSDVPIPKHHWAESVYGKTTEQVSHHVSEINGKQPVTLSWVDSNLLHCHLTGRCKRYTTYS